MFKVPTLDSHDGLSPTPINPATAAVFGDTVADLGKGLEGIGEVVQKLDNQRQTLKAQAYLARAHRENYKLAATDPDVDGLDEKISKNSYQSIEDASKFITNQTARDQFVEKAQYQSEIRNVPISNMILRRKSQDLKNSLVIANDEDIKTYTSLADPEDRKLLKQGIIDRTDQAIQDGHVNADWAKLHVSTLLKQADLKQVQDDMAINAEHTYQQLQKGSEGLYPDISPKHREQFAKQAEKLISKQGAENNMIYSIAQNHTENVLIDKMAHNTLTQEDVTNSILFGINGVKSTPTFVKAATEALDDPFPTDSAPDKYNKLFDLVTNPDKEPAQVKLDVLRSRGLTPQQKAHLINGSLREDPSGDGTQSIANLVQDGLSKNKQQILELNRKVQNEVEQKRSVLGKIGELFADHAKDDKHLASLQQQLMEKATKVKSTEDLIAESKNILNQDTLRSNPKFSTLPKEGKIMIDAKGNKARVYPDGSFEEI